MNGKQLWGSLLQQAVSGKLVEQIDSEPAVDQIGTAPAPEEVPFEIPEKWQWVPLANVCTYIQRGKSPKYSEIKQLPVVAQKCNQWDGLHMESALFIDPATIPSYKPERFLQSNDVLLNSTGTGTLGRVGLYNPAVNPYDQAVADGHVTVIRADQRMILPPFVKYVLTSTAFQTIILAAGSGTTKQQELALSKVKQLVIPLPPLAEQRRIVAKLEELKPLVERFGEAHDELVKLEAEFPRSLKAYVLQYAVSGQLVPQLDTEPAVEQIGSAPAPEEVPFEIPEKWQWVPLANVCTYIQRGKSPKYSEIKQLPVVAQKCNQWDGLHMESALFIDPATIPSYKPERFLQSNDVLLNSTGTGTLGRVGLYNPAVNPYDQAVADGHVTVIRADQRMILPPFVKYVLTSTAFQTIILAAGSGTTKQQELALSKVKQLVIPLPPLAEQRRIVAKLNEILADVEKMERLTSASQ